MRLQWTPLVPARGMAPGAPKEGFDAIPMWVADMNFPTVPTVQEAIIERVQHPAFGYFSLPDAYFSSIIRWQETRNHVTGLTRECIGYENGVLGASSPQSLRSLHRAMLFCCTAQPISALPAALRTTVLKSSTARSQRMKNGIWRMDYADMDAKLKANHIHVAVFCSHTIHVAVSGNAGKSKKQWRSTKQMTVSSSLMKSGLTSPWTDTSTFRHSRSARMPDTVRSPFMRRAKPSTSPVWSQLPYCLRFVSAGPSAIQEQ